MSGKGKKPEAGRNFSLWREGYDALSKRKQDRDEHKAGMIAQTLAQEKQGDTK